MQAPFHRESTLTLTSVQQPPHIRSTLSPWGEGTTVIHFRKSLSGVRVTAMQPGDQDNTIVTSGTG